MKAHSYYRQYSQWSLEAVVDRFATLNRFVENDLDSNSFVYNHMYSPAMKFIYLIVNTQEDDFSTLRGF